MQVSKTVNDDKQGFWLERIFLEKERSSKRTMVFDIGRKNIKSKLNDEEHIIYEKCLKVSLNDSKIELEIFYAVYENITAYERIEENG